MKNKMIEKSRKPKFDTCCWLGMSAVNLNCWIIVLVWLCRRPGHMTPSEQWL